jgi:hypothetical protein
MKKYIVFSSIILITIILFFIIIKKSTHKSLIDTALENSGLTKKDEFLNKKNTFSNSDLSLKQHFELFINNYAPYMKCFIDKMFKDGVKLYNQNKIKLIEKSNSELEYIILDSNNKIRSIVFNNIFDYINDFFEIVIDYIIYNKNYEYFTAFMIGFFGDKKILSEGGIKAEYTRNGNDIKIYINNCCKDIARGTDEINRCITNISKCEKCENYSENNSGKCIAVDLLKDYNNYISNHQVEKSKGEYYNKMFKSTC